MPSTTIRYFAFEHLPDGLKVVSRPVGELATLLEGFLPDGPEKSAGMRKLLEAKDCFVRSAMDIPAETLPKGSICLVRVQGQHCIVKPHELRVIQEQEQLRDRIEKLEAFMHADFGDKFMQLPQEDQDLLKKQLATMKPYHDVLVHRIARFCKPANPV